jgi:hypothetical protein
MTASPTTTLTRAAGLGAVAAGLLFIGVQIKHPPLTVDLVTTTEWIVRESAKIAMAVLSLVGVTGMYLHQVRRIGVLGLLGYLVSATGYLIILGVQVIAVCVLPTLARQDPGYVKDVLAVAGGGHAVGDIGLMVPLSLVGGITYIGGGVLFGIALFRAGVLARWAAALLAVGSLATAAIPLLPQLNERLFAVPPSIALIGLGWSLWRDQRSPAAETAAVVPQRDPAGVR